jgi:translation initiation factor IF-2
MEKEFEKSQDMQLTPRPPIVVVMGHIDHGKSTLLDFIRKSNIAEKEAGGITQHIGAYEAEVYTKSGEGGKITFLDTPGHEAFSKIRSRGVSIADIAILVIAADDGVKPQTKEALEIIKRAEMPFVVAINKIDASNADPERVKKELSENGVFIEEWGGKIPAVTVSAKTGQNIDDLLELILLTAQMEDLKANPKVNASGVIIESHLDSKRGALATLIIQNGVLRKGMFVQAGDAIAPVKILEDFNGHNLEEARFSSPVRVVGFNKLPLIGIAFASFFSKKEAEKAARNSQDEKDSKKLTPSVKTSDFETIDFHLVLKADASGSLEVLEDEVLKFQNENVSIDILSSKVGNITEEDIKLASSGTNPIVIGFHVGIEGSVDQLVKSLGVTVETFNIIYKMNEWLKEEIEKRAIKEVREEIIGRAQVLKVFKKNKNRQIIGGKVATGKIINNFPFKLIRKDAALAEGKIIDLEQNRIKTKEVKEGSEFGAAVEVKVEITENDFLEIFERIYVKKKIYGSA